MTELKDAGVAAELAESQQEISIAEFFEQNKQMLGFGSKTRALVTAVKEAVDNSIDATEEADIFPDISVEIIDKNEYYTLIVEDNGPGIPKENVPNVFGKLLYGSRFHTRAQSRGQQGIGISAAVLYSQLTSGNPARITSKPAEFEKGYYVELGIDTDTNEPILQSESEVEWDKDHGTRVELDMEGNMRARKRLYQYIRQTAVVNPHTTLSLHEPNGELVYDERAVNELPDKVEEIKPHPHGVELGTLMDMIDSTDSYKLTSFFQEEFTRVGPTTAEDILNHFRDRHFGRNLSWPLYGESGRDDYISLITEKVNKKGEDETNLFAKKILDKLEQYDCITIADVRENVKHAADEAENETNKKFGETVQNKTVEAIWTEVQSNVSEYTIKKVDEITIDRKNKELVNKMGERLSEQFHTNGFTRCTKDELEEYVNKAAKYATRRVDNGKGFGEKSQNKIIDYFWENSDHSDESVPKVSEIDRDMAKNLLEGMKEAKVMAPPKKCLSPISEDNIVAGLKAQYNAEFYTSVTRSASVTRGEPFIVEAGIAYGGELENGSQIKLNRYANRVPLVYQQGACAITKSVKDITWNNYYRKQDKLSQNSGSLPQGPMVLVVHVASTNVPFTSESKDAISSVPEIENEVERAVRNVARDLKDHLKEKRDRKQRKKKQDKIGGILSDMTDKLEEITGEKIESKQESQAKILNNIFIDVSGNNVIITNYRGKKETIDISINNSKNVDGIREEIGSGETITVNVGTDITPDDLSIKSPEEPKITLNLDD